MQRIEKITGAPFRVKCSRPTNRQFDPNERRELPTIDPLLTQIERILKVNQLDKVSKEIVAGRTRPAWSSDRSDLRKVPTYAR
jgi:hypothetical protein